MSDPITGIKFQSVDEDALPVIEADMSVVGIVGPDAGGVDANGNPIDLSEKFPLDDAVGFNSNDKAYTALLDPNGLIYDALQAINLQLAEMQRAAKVVYVRTAAGTNADATLKMWETIANIAGDANAKTGIHALTEAGQRIGTVPRIIITPGYDSQQKTGVVAITGLVGGTGYLAGGDGTFTVTATGGGGTGFSGTATVKTGVITAIKIDANGTDYTSSPTLDFSAGGGTGASAVAGIGPLANPIVAQLTSVLDQVLGVAIVNCPGTTRDAAVNYRETIQSKRIIPVEPAILKTASDGSTISRPASPYIAGIAVRRDYEKNGRPFHSWMNQPIVGIEGISRSIAFSIVDGANEGQDLLAHQIGPIVRGESGDDFAIANGGFIYMGTDTCSEDPIWTFYNQVRGRDFIHLGMLRTLRFYLGRYNITGHTIQAVLNTMGFWLRDLKADEDILGYQVQFTGDQNTPEELRLGHLTVRFAAEEPPVLRKLTVQSARYRPALDATVADVISQLNTVF